MKCFACGRRLGKNPTLVTCRDEQDVFVGTECAKLIVKSGASGWQPPNGGPRLFALKFDPKGAPTYPELSARMDRAHKTRAPLTDNATSHLKNALQVSALLAAELPKMIHNPGHLEDAMNARAAIDDRIRSALGSEPKGDAEDFPCFVNGERFKRQYPDQHPAEAALDYIAAVLRDHTRGHGEQRLRASAAVEDYFAWKAGQ